MDLFNSSRWSQRLSLVCPCGAWAVHHPTCLCCCPWSFQHLSLFFILLNAILNFLERSKLSDDIEHLMLQACFYIDTVCWRVLCSYSFPWCFKLASYQQHTKVLVSVHVSRCHTACPELELGTAPGDSLAALVHDFPFIKVHPLWLCHMAQVVFVKPHVVLHVQPVGHVESGWFIAQRQSTVSHIPKLHELMSRPVLARFVYCGRVVMSCVRRHLFLCPKNISAKQTALWHWHHCLSIVLPDTKFLRYTFLFRFQNVVLWLIYISTVVSVVNQVSFERRSIHAAGWVSTRCHHCCYLLWSRLSPRRRHWCMTPTWLNGHRDLELVCYKDWSDVMYMYDSVVISRAALMLIQCC